ncbi:hypothetical protein DYY67_0185 [Candidatus Nitrosotalea sp. TS]|nr:hypothetical protein [Candidatus Nitrosotalea sp. TS]
MNMHIKKIHVILALIILIPSFIDLTVPIYNRDAPELFGIAIFLLVPNFVAVCINGILYCFCSHKGENHE